MKKELKLIEKIGQMSQNLFGWECYQDKGNKFTSKFYDELNKYGTIGYIYGLLRSDPWSKVNFETGINHKEASKILNSFQREIIAKGGVPALFVEEAPHGHQGLNSTILPVNLAIGATFNTDLYKKNLANVAKEIRYKGAHIALMSVFDLALDPRWGRTEECYGEDTYLSMKMAESVVLGMQGNEYKIPSDKVAVVAKHFIGQGSSLGGHNGKTVSIGKNELRNTHYPISDSLTNLGVAGVMIAYNDLDGVPCHSNPELLQNYFENERKYNGILMSDGCAIDNLTHFLVTDENAIAAAINAGMSVDLWNKTYNALPSAFEQNLVDIDRFNKSFNKTIQLKERLDLFNNPYQDESKYQEIDFAVHDKDNLELATESIVLLKNDGILPRKLSKDDCLIGIHGDDVYHQLGDYTSYQDLKKTKKLSEVFDIPYAKGTNLRKVNEQWIKEAVELAKKSKTVYLTIGSSSKRKFDQKFDSNGAAILDPNFISEMDCGEGADVMEIKLSEAQQKLFDSIFEVNQNIVTIVISGRPIGIETIVKNSKAVLQSFYPGAMGAMAIKNIVEGSEAPSGRLPISIPYSSGQIPVYYWMKETGKYVDLYTQDKTKPLFAFGFGLTYGDVVSSIDTIEKIGNNKYNIKVKVQNHSDRKLKHSILIFSKIKFSTIKPFAKQLVAFKKITLQQNSIEIVNVEIDVNWIHNNYNFKEIDFLL